MSIEPLTRPEQTDYCFGLMTMETIQQVGVKAAYRAGDILKNHFGNLKEIRKKGVFDLVTQADLDSEQTIIDCIHSDFPRHGIIAEESGAAAGDSDAQWIIDPLDGTTNFAHHVSLFCISIAYAEGGKVLFGIVYNPMTAELFTAQSGKGAWLNGHPLEPSSISAIEDSLLVTGFTSDVDRRSKVLLDRFASCLDAAQGIRRLGSAALDLCYVACGRFDGFWEEHLKPWDTAAGALIAEEAGGRVSDFNDAPYRMENRQILATNGRIHSAMLSLLTSKDTR